MAWARGRRKKRPRELPINTPGHNSILGLEENAVIARLATPPRPSTWSIAWPLYTPTRPRYRAPPPPPHTPHDVDATSARLRRTLDEVVRAVPPARDRCGRLGELRTPSPRQTRRDVRAEAGRWAATLAATAEPARAPPARAHPSRDGVLGACGVLLRSAVTRGAPGIAIAVSLGPILPHRCMITKPVKLPLGLQTTHAAATLRQVGKQVPQKSHIYSDRRQARLHRVQHLGARAEERLLAALHHAPPPLRHVTRTVPDRAE